MVNRKKRLEKGIESLNKQIEFHKEKRESAKIDENIDLEKYYAKELEGLERTKERKEKLLEKG